MSEGPCSNTRYRWIAVSDDVGYLGSYSDGDKSMHTADRSDQAADPAEIRALRELMLEKISLCESLRDLFFRSELCHKKTVSDLTRVLEEQARVLDANQAAFRALELKFAHDAEFVRKTLARYLDDDLSPSAALQGEIAPGVHVRREALDSPSMRRDGPPCHFDGTHWYLDTRRCERDLDDL